MSVGPAVKQPEERERARFDPDDLVFDERNPRLSSMLDVVSQEQILRRLWRESAVDEIAFSISANGYFDFEPLMVAREEGKNVVIEGNRRLAALKILLSPQLRQELRATDLPDPSEEVISSLRQIPAILCDRDEIWRYVGFKHVNGPKQWDAMAKAEYITWVHEELGVPLDDIARQIGDRHTTVIRLYNGLITLNQAEEAGVWNRDRRFHKRFFFSHLYTGLGYEGFQNYLGLASNRTELPKNPVPSEKTKELGEVFTWLFGDKQSNSPPLVVSQNPDLRRLDEVLSNSNGVSAIRKGLTLSVSLDISRGDERILRENLVSAKSSLQTVKARLVTGYEGDEGVRENAYDVFDLAESILDEIELLDERRERAANPESGRSRRSRARR